MTTQAAATTIHANALLVGPAGVLLRGRSGAGKSALTEDLIALARGAGFFARLIGDDRVRVSRRHGRLVARPHPRIAGLIETRGVGVIACDHEPAGVIRLVVDLVAAVERMPDAATLETALCGVALPRLCEATRGPQAARRIVAFLQRMGALS